LLGENKLKNDPKDLHCYCDIVREIRKEQTDFESGEFDGGANG